ncbi:MAG TPA: hypothetical protein VF861_15155 [Telluria sp.]
MSLDAHAQSAGITPLGRYGATSSVNFTWKHQLNKTLSLTVNASDIFDGSRRSYRTESSAFRQAGFDHSVAQRGLTRKVTAPRPRFCVIHPPYPAFHHKPFARPLRRRYSGITPARTICRLSATSFSAISAME